MGQGWAVGAAEIAAKMNEKLIPKRWNRVFF
jgi:hypothetical protein